MPRRKRIPPKPVAEDTIIIEHEEVEEYEEEEYEYRGSSKQSTKVEELVCDLSSASDDVIEILKRSYSKDPVERKAALKSMCPCKVKREIDPFWQRIVEMTKDENASVRYQVLHSLCDGSPARIEELVVETVRSFWNDSDDKIKRSARRAYNSWQRGDGINIL